MFEEKMVRKGSIELYIQTFVINHFVILVYCILYVIFWKNIYPIYMLHLCTDLSKCFVPSIQVGKIFLHFMLEIVQEGWKCKGILRNTWVY